jgi:cobalt/nickel transport system ATP-binding protein
VAALSDVILETRGLVYNYDREVHALRGLDFTARRGRKLAVLGANGAGKSTLFLHLNGTLRPETGEIRINGQLAGYRRRELLEWRQRVGLVFQNPDDQLFAPTVEQDISFGPVNLGLDKDEVYRRVDESLRAMGIEDLRERPVHSLSFGQKKRAAIAGIVAMRPEVLILDEPSAGLDPRGVESLLAVLEELHRAGTTLIMATHDVDLACAWADEVAVLRMGRVEKQGSVEEVLSDPHLMRSSDLRAPLVFEIAARLMAQGYLPDVGTLPRSREALLAMFPPTRSESQVKSFSTPRSEK